MKSLVRQAMQEGAIGVSTSLQYAPAPTRTEELVALASEAARLGGIYASHIRDEGDSIMPALDEAFRIGREARIPVEIWHLKAAGKSNWGRMPQIVAHIEQARREGVDVAADTYAYPAAFNSFSAVIPPWAHDGGDKKLIERLRDPAMRERIRKELLTPSSAWNNEWQQVTGPDGFILSAVQNPKLLPLQGKTIAEIAKLCNQDPIDTAMDILIEDEAFTMVGMFIMNEPDVALALEQPWVSVCNDSQGTALDGVLDAAPRGPMALSPRPPQVRCEEHKLTSEPFANSQPAGAAHALRRSRGVEGGDVGRCGGVRPGDSARPGDVRSAQSIVGGNALRAGERRAGDRGR
jgi:dihydroorotase/N-acyl-D-amino-acid deacylase